MPRRKTPPGVTHPAPQGTPPIDPLRVYYVADLKPFRIGARTLRREHALGRLRVGRRCKWRYVLGSWLLEWFERGELKKAANPPQSG